MLALRAEPKYMYFSHVYCTCLSILEGSVKTELLLCEGDRNNLPVTEETYYVQIDWSPRHRLIRD